jgi:hypothetical protein
MICIRNALFLGNYPKSLFSPDQGNPDSMNVGQIKILGISSSEPAGKPLTDIQMKTANSDT